MSLLYVDCIKNFTNCHVSHMLFYYINKKKYVIFIYLNDTCYFYILVV
jgi:hypothetical protein